MGGVLSPLPETMMFSIVFSRRAFSRILPANANGKPAFVFRHEWIDYPVRILAALFFAFAAGIYFRNASHKIDLVPFDAAALASIVSLAAIGLYTFMLACLYALRLRPVNKFAGIVPAVTSIVGCFLLSALLFCPPVDLPVGMKIFAAALIVAGNLFTVYALAYLGRSFSILPEGRRLVTSGPYRLMRNPVYLGEAVATIGAMITLFSPWAALIVLAQFALQLARIIYEERVLRATFPEYADYAKRTARLIPGVY
jgi:protein-S-isoprenylcysteine O-methyltransferase Ste14